MVKEIILPKGLYLVGRDIPEGVYLIKIKKFAWIEHSHKDCNGENTEDSYLLNEDDTECRLRFEKGDKLKVQENFAIQRIADTLINFD